MTSKDIDDMPLRFQLALVRILQSRIDNENNTPQHESDETHWSFDYSKMKGNK